MCDDDDDDDVGGVLLLILCCYCNGGCYSYCAHRGVGGSQDQSHFTSNRERQRFCCSMDD